MMKKLEFYFSFRSPYSYLAIDRLGSIIDEFNLDADLRIVRPLALREPDFFKNNRPQFMGYFLQDVMREAARCGLPISHPSPDPIDMNMMTGEVNPAQPIMDNIIGLGLAAKEQGRGFAFASEVSKLVWQGTKDWNTGECLKDAAARAGLEYPVLKEWQNANQSQIKKMIEENEATQNKYHWGVPLMVLEREAFFGQDRLDALVWRLKSTHG